MRALDLLFEERGKVVLPLLDPDKVVAQPYYYQEVLQKIEPWATAFLVGGSTGFSQLETETTVKLVKNNTTNKKVIIFPGSPCQVAPSADAILFMSLLNSTNRKYLIDSQVEGAILVYKYGLEAIPTAYIIVGEGGTAGWVGDAKPIPFDKPEILVAYSLAAKYMGFKVIYLEAGSGAKEHIPFEAVKMVKKVVGDDVLLIVGGGIRNPEVASKMIESGADGIVIGTILEREPERAVEIARAVRK